MKKKKLLFTTLLATTISLGTILSTTIDAKAYIRNDFEHLKKHPGTIRAIRQGVNYGIYTPEATKYNKARLAYFDAKTNEERAKAEKIINDIDDREEAEENEKYRKIYEKLIAFNKNNKLQINLVLDEKDKPIVKGEIKPAIKEELKPIVKDNNDNIEIAIKPAVKEELKPIIKEEIKQESLVIPIQSGWVLDEKNNNWYFLNNSGVKQTGWISSNNNWYYLDNSGAMKTGWVSSNNNWYYLDNSGAMKTSGVIDGWKITSNGIAVLHK